MLSRSSNEDIVNSSWPMKEKSKRRSTRINLSWKARSRDVFVNVFRLTTTVDPSWTTKSREVYADVHRWMTVRQVLSIWIERPKRWMRRGEQQNGRRCHWHDNYGWSQIRSNRAVPIRVFAEWLGGLSKLPNELICCHGLTCQRCGREKMVGKLLECNAEKRLPTFPG